MKLGIILQSNKPEHAWNTFRLGITALKKCPIAQNGREFGQSFNIRLT